MLDDTDRALLDKLIEQLGLRLTAEQVGQLLDYLRLLLKWNRVYNLTAVRDTGEMVVQHVGDCLAVVRPLVREISSLGDRPRVLDVGSGAGLPGAILAIALPDAKVTCVDTVGKKASFVQQVAGELGLANLRSAHGRVEQLDALACDVITSRAFSSLSDLTRLTRHHLAPAGVWMAMKGRVPQDEIDALDPNVNVFHVEQLTIPSLDAERCLVWMRPPPALERRSSGRRGEAH